LRRAVRDCGCRFETAAADSRLATRRLEKEQRWYTDAIGSWTVIARSAAPQTPG